MPRHILHTLTDCDSILNEMADKITPSELIHIWKNEPCEPGDTLSGGSNVAELKRFGLIESSCSGYVTTANGKRIVQRLIEYLDKLEVTLTVDIAVHTRN